MNQLQLAPMSAKCAASRPSPSLAFRNHQPRLLGKRRTLGCSCSTRLTDADDVGADDVGADGAGADGAGADDADVDGADVDGAGADDAGADAGQTGTGQAITQYYSAGQSWCGFSNMQRDAIASASPAVPVQYVDCTPGSATAGHVACQVKARGFPYLVKCEDSDCTIVKYGVMTPAQLAAQLAAKVVDAGV